ncbi:hypothetical protein B0H13DRAFT_1888932 [Mycena leptocephala]|nr:hypothetical protein B0H13DRAFT_1888932 [Mycena leptocephala]
MEAPTKDLSQNSNWQNNMGGCGRLPHGELGGSGSSRLILGSGTLPFQREGGRLWKAPTCPNGRHWDLPHNTWKGEVDLPETGWKVVEGSRLFKWKGCGSLWEASTCWNGRHWDLPYNAWKGDVDLPERGWKPVGGSHRFKWEVSGPPT